MNDNRSVPIRAALDGRRITVSSDAEHAPTVQQLPGATRTALMPPNTWTMPLNLDSIQALRSAGAQVSRELLAEAKRLISVRQYLGAQKQGDRQAVPLCPMPIRQGVQPYQHQIRAYNIVLALFGYAPEFGGDVQ